MFIFPVFTNPIDVDRQKYLGHVPPLEYVVSSDDESIDLKSSYYVCNIEYDAHLTLLKQSLVSCIITDQLREGVSTRVYNNCLKFLEHLSPNLCDNLGKDDIYHSNYGTVILEWNKSNNELFSLEIGKESIGYFIEKNGVDTKQIDSLSLSENEFQNTVLKVNKDLSSFL
jgi:hypothetical protein